MEAKFGNFNTPIIMKLCSKYNKKITSERIRANPNAIADQIAERLNLNLGNENSNLRQKQPLVYSEIKSFTNLNAFINVFLNNP